MPRHAEGSLDFRRQSAAEMFYFLTKFNVEIRAFTQASVHHK